MVFALEGPDGCGKTTVRDLVREAFGPSFRVRYPAVAPLVSRAAYADDPAAATHRDAVLFGSLYDPRVAYVAARFFAVSAPVYDAARARFTHSDDYSVWYPHVTVLYLRAPVGVLAARLRERGDVREVTGATVANLRRIADAYERLFADAPFARVLALDATRPPKTLAADVAEVVRAWIHETEE